MIEHILDYREYLEDLRAFDRWNDDGGPPPAPPVMLFSTGWRPTPQAIEDVRYASMADYMASLKECVNLANARLHQSWYDGDCHNSSRIQKLKLETYLGGLKSAREARDLYRTGWPQAEERMRKLLEEFSVDAVPHDHRRRMRWGEFGDNLDISRVYSGHHNEAWSSARRKYMMAPQRVTIVANMICPWFDPVDVLFWRGAAAIILSDLLEAAGYMTKIDFGSAGNMASISFKDKTRPSVPMGFRVTMKDFGNPVDISTMTAALHGGFVRAMNGAWKIGHCPEELTHSSFYVGTCIRDDGDILASHDVNTEMSARAWIRAELDKINRLDC